MKRAPKDNGNTSSTSDVKPNGPTGSSIIRNNTYHGGAKSTNIIKHDKSIAKKVQGTRIDSRTTDNLRQKDQITQEI